MRAAADQFLDGQYGGGVVDSRGNERGDMVEAGVGGTGLSTDILASSCPQVRQNVMRYSGYACGMGAT